MQNTFLEHGFELSPLELEQFKKFLALFSEYNAHTNLSAIRDEEGIILKHFVDSLYGTSIITSLGGEVPTIGGGGDLFLKTSKYPPQPPLTGGLPETKNQEPRTIKLLDIGSGGGFPGIPLKIVNPELQVTLLDSIGKKVKAMNHFVAELGLPEITAIQERAEVLAKSPEHAGKYDFVVSRATAYMTDILTWASPFLKASGKIVLYKMPSEDEKKDIEKVCKKLKLVLEGELEYELGGKERIIYVFGRK